MASLGGNVNKVVEWACQAEERAGAKVQSMGVCEKTVCSGNGRDLIIAGD